MGKYLSRTTCLLLSLSLITGCGSSKGFTAASLAPGGNNDGTGVPDAGIQFNEMDLMGSVSGGPADKSSAIVYDKSEHAIQLRVPLPGAAGNIDMEIPNVPGSRVYLDTTNPVLPILVVSVPALYVLGKIGFDPGQVGLDPTLLPNGQPIPFTPGGEPPVVSFLVPKINRVVQIYLGINVVAVFTEISLDPMADLTFPIRNKSKTQTIGYFSTVRRRNPHLGGLFVSLNMPTKIAGALDDYLRKIIVP